MAAVAGNDAGQPVKRKVAEACLQCKRRRRKCTGTAPCELCARHGLACVFEGAAAAVAERGYCCEHSVALPDGAQPWRPPLPEFYIPHAERKLVMMYFRLLQQDIPLVDQTVLLDILSGTAFLAASDADAPVATSTSPPSDAGAAAAEPPTVAGVKRAREGGNGGAHAASATVDATASPAAGVAVPAAARDGSSEPKPTEEELLESLLDETAGAPYAVDGTPVSLVDRREYAFSCHVLYHCVVATGASLIGHGAEVRDHYHRAVALLGPVVVRPSSPTVSSLVLLALLTRVISLDKRQSVHYLRLAESMIDWAGTDAADPAAEYTTPIYSAPSSGAAAAIPGAAPTTHATLPLAAISRSASLSPDSSGGTRPFPAAADMGGRSASSSAESDDGAVHPPAKRARLAASGDSGGMDTAASAVTPPLESPPSGTRTSTSAAEAAAGGSGGGSGAAAAAAATAAAVHARHAARQRLRSQLRVRVQPEVALALSLFRAMSDPESDDASETVEPQSQQPLTHARMCALVARLMRLWIHDFAGFRPEDEARERRIVVTIARHCSQHQHLSPVARLVRTYLLDAFSGMLHMSAGRIDAALADFARLVHVQALLSPERRMKSVLNRLRTVARRTLATAAALPEAQRAQLASIEAQASALLQHNDRFLEDLDAVGALPIMSPRAPPVGPGQGHGPPRTSRGSISVASAPVASAMAGLSASSKAAAAPSRAAPAAAGASEALRGSSSMWLASTGSAAATGAASYVPPTADMPPAPFGNPLSTSSSTAEIATLLSDTDSDGDGMGEGGGAPGIGSSTRGMPSATAARSSSVGSVEGLFGSQGLLSAAMLASRGGMGGGAPGDGAMGPTLFDAFFSPDAWMSTDALLAELGGDLGATLEAPASSSDAVGPR